MSNLLPFLDETVLPPLTKKCIKCGQEKTLDNYGYRSRDKFGNPGEQRNDCKDCIYKESKIRDELRKMHPPPAEDYKCPGCLKTSKDIMENRHSHYKVTKSAFVLDHNHETGEFNGWLCDNCNYACGRANDDPEILRRLANYKEKTNKNERYI